MAKALLTGRCYDWARIAKVSSTKIEFPEIPFRIETLPRNLEGGEDEMDGPLWLSRVRIYRAFGHSRRMQLKALGSAKSIGCPSNR